METKRFKPDALLIIAFVALGMMVCIAAYGIVFKSRPDSSRVPSRVVCSPVAFDVTPDGKSLVVGLEGGGLILIDRASGRKVKELAPEGFAPNDPALSPDGKYLAYSAGLRNGGDCHLFLWEWQTANKARQLTTGPCDSLPTFSRDGKRIAFNRVVHTFSVKMSSPSTPCVVNADGTNLLRPAQKTFASLSRLRFSPDGRSLLFSGYESNPNSSVITKTASGLFSVSLNAPYPVKDIWVPVGAVASYPDISRDGKKLVFVSDGQERFVYELYVSDMPPSDVVRLQSGVVSHYIESPRFTPDGRRVLFLAAPRNTPDAGTPRGVWQLWEGDANGAKDFRLIYPRPETPP